MNYNEIFSNERYIPFENLRNRGIQKDDKSNIDVSFFREIYHQARNLTKVIIEANQSLDETKDANVFQQTFDMQNIVAFTGRRGTGKTSAMLAFADFLADNCTGLGEDFLELSKDYKFFVLQYVDSSAVSDKEDFFEILLFRMLQYLNYISENSGINNRQRMNAELDALCGDISKIYSHYSSLDSHNFDESASYTIMERYISKHDVRREFRELVLDYNEFLLKYSGDSRAKKGFLVLCIDDIDMSRQEHLKILQCIYQYFMIPGVIVYMTMNTPILMANVKKNFYESMDINAPEEKERILELCKEQTIDFLRKILPSDMRITMPSWKKYDYKKLSTIKIILKREGVGEQELGKIFPNLKGANWCLNPEGEGWTNSSSNFSTDVYGKKYVDISPKLFVMKLLAERTKIFLDTKGYKSHFMEPDSLRNLYDIFYLLYNMQNITGSEYSHVKCEYNRKILLDYLYFKMIPEMQISNNEYKLIRSIQSEPISRRGRRIWEYYFRRFEANYEEINKLYSDARSYGSVNEDCSDFVFYEKIKHRIENYNFGEMFRCLYYGSRLNLFSKDFVKSVLASYAFSMPQLVEKEKDRKNEHDAEQLASFFDYILNNEDSTTIDSIEDSLGLEINQLDKNYLKQKISNPKSKISLVDKLKSPEILDKWVKFVCEKGKGSSYTDEYFYSFRELRDVLGYSFLGQWSVDLTGLNINEPCYIKLEIPKYKEINQNKKNNLKKSIERIINALLLLPISSKNNSILFSVEAGELKIHDIKPDPTSPMLGLIKISHILNYRFNNVDKSKDMVGLNLAEVIVYCAFDKNFSAKNGLENLKKKYQEKIDSINNIIIEIIIEKYFNINLCYWFMVKHTDVTYNVIKRTIKHFLYLSDENLQIYRRDDKSINEIFDNFYKRFDIKLKEVADDYNHDELKRLFVDDKDGKNEPKTHFTIEWEKIKDTIAFEKPKNKNLSDYPSGDGISSEDNSAKESDNMSDNSEGEKKFEKYTI